LLLARYAVSEPYVPDPHEHAGGSLSGEEPAPATEAGNDANDTNETAAAPEAGVPDASGDTRDMASAEPESSEAAGAPAEGEGHSDEGAPADASKEGAGGAPARRRQRDPAVLRAFRAGLPVEGTVEKVIKGGYEVRVGRLRGFCPHSQMDVARVENPDEHVGKTYAWRILQLRRGGKTSSSRAAPCSRTSARKSVPQSAPRWSKER
jgi:hypothetical protein